MDEEQILNQICLNVIKLAIDPEMVNMLKCYKTKDELDVNGKIFKITTKESVCLLETTIHDQNINI